MPRIPLRYMLGGAAIYVAATSAGYLYIQASRAGNVSYAPVILEDPKRRKTYDGLAPCYDSKIGWDEFFMGMGILRWWNMRRVKGRVVEVGCGTGRNLPYYPKEAQLIAVDASPEMIRTATNKAGSRKNLQLAVMDGHALEFEDSSFDFAVDTFGLCSYADPIKVLQEMQRVVKPDGQIILMEHGLSKYHLLNNLLNKHAQDHADQWGCIWNKDIEQLVKAAGLQIEKQKRYHFGTTYVIIASKKK